MNGFAIEPSAEISHRTDFSLLCNARGYVDAVEIGTDVGVFAADFLSRFKGHWLYCIDPYLPHPDFPLDRTGDMLAAIVALTPYSGHFRLVKARSVEAAPWVRTMITPEFVYIDGSHIEADVAADLATWWDLVPGHGMLAGHDFDSGHPGVVAAVTRFAQERDLAVRLTHEADRPSWYLYKTEPEMLYHRLFREGESSNPRAAP